MDARNQLLELFTPLSISDKLLVIEEFVSIFETEQQIQCKEASADLTKLMNQNTEQQVDNKVNADLEFEQIDSLIPPMIPQTTYAQTNNPEEKQNELLPRKPAICPDCNSSKTIGWGNYNGCQRYKCRGCGHTFTLNTGTVFHGIKKIEKFVDFGKTMFNGQYYSLAYLSKKHEVSKSTVFDWRHKYLSSLNSTAEDIKFSGAVEMDDVWVLFNEKGRQDKDNSRKRGGASTPGDNDMQVKVLFTVQRGGASNLSVVRSGRLCKADISRAVGKKFERDAILISDKHPSITAFAKDTQLTHKSFNASEHCKDKEIHVQTVNFMASRFKGIINTKMRGVATKYLQNYAQWFNIEERYKTLINKIVRITDEYLIGQSSWDYFINMEKTYKRFLEKYSHLQYENPVKREWKTCNWNFERIENLLL